MPELRDVGRTIFEHNEVSDSPTACPSGRYAPFYEALNKWKEDELTPEYEAFLKRAVDAAVFDRLTAIENLLAGATGGTAMLAFGDLSKRGIAPLINRVESLEKNGDSVARTNINGHIANHQNQGGGKVGAHTHKPGAVE